MGTLKYAILGLLNRKSMTGYDLKKEFETTLFEFWSAKHSQIYPELKELTKEKLISFKIEISGTILEKKVYTITDSGKKELQNWLLEKEDKNIIPKDEFKLRLFFSDVLPVEKRIELIDEQYYFHNKRKEYFEQKLSKFSNIPPKMDSELSDYLVLLGGIKRENMLCEWLIECKKLIANKEEQK